MTENVDFSTRTSIRKVTDKPSNSDKTAWYDCEIIQSIPNTAWTDGLTDRIFDLPVGTTWSLRLVKNGCPGDPDNCTKCTCYKSKENPTDGNVAPVG